MTAATFAAPSARAQDYRPIVLDGHTMKWGAPVPGSGATVTYAVADGRRAFAGVRNCPVVDPPDRLLAVNGIARASFDGELAAAFAAWSKVADIRFRRVDAADADILIGAEGVPAGRAFTNVEYHDPGRSRAPASLSRSLICLNPEMPWKVGFDGNLGVYDLRYALTHEIGHAIGLDHSGQTGELMDFRYREDFRVPQLGDSAGAVFLYGRSRLPTGAVSAVVRKVGRSANRR